MGFRLRAVPLGTPARCARQAYPALISMSSRLTEFAGPGESRWGRHGFVKVPRSCRQRQPSREIRCQVTSYVVATGQNPVWT